LTKIQEERPERSNCHIYNSVKPVLAANREEAQKKIDAKLIDVMELDVVVILGYQLLLFSCTAFDDVNKTEVKRKAMEAMHRAQQIGGEEARVVVVSSVEKTTAKQISAELFEDCGRGINQGLLEIWGHDTWKDIEVKIDNYIRNTIRWS
jgi:hypothetical protein